MKKQQFQLCATEADVRNIRFIVQLYSTALYDCITILGVVIQSRTVHPLGISNIQLLYYVP